MATVEQKRKAYSDAVEIVKAACSSTTDYTIAGVPNLLQGVYDKLVELMDDTVKS